MKNNKVRVLICGAGFSGNKGAEAMYDSVIDGIKKNHSEVQFGILSKYPRDDRPACEKRGIKLHEFPTVKQATHGFSFYLIAGILKKLHLPYRKLINETVAPFFKYDILVDTSGIAFSSDRSFSGAVINSLWFFPAFISGIPIIKVSQSLGPYNKWYVHLFAKYVLNRINVIVCRGDESYECTSKLLPNKKVYNFPDVAINLIPTIGKEETELLDENHLKKNDYVVIGPSFVMKGILGDSYSKLICACIYEMKKLIPSKTMVLVPHSRKHSAAVGVDSTSDDYSVCKEIADKMMREKGIRCVVVGREYSAHELKTIIGNAYIAIGSRFHFLVAALSSGVPGIALGWSYKYKELFSEFGMERFVREYHDFNTKDILILIKELIERQSEIKADIAAVLPDVKKRSHRNIELIENKMQRVTKARI